MRSSAGKSGSPRFTSIGYPSDQATDRVSFSHQRDAIMRDRGRRRQVVETIGRSRGQSGEIALHARPEIPADIRRRFR